MSTSHIARTLLAAATITTLGFATASTCSAQVWNPVIIDSGKQITGVTYDPFTGRIRVRTDHRKVRESVTDPNRRHSDPGSFEHVNEFQTDRNGVRWHVTGTRWTSFGVPHGNLNRRRVSGIGGGIDHDENEQVIYSPMSNSKTGGTSKSKTQSTKVQTPRKVYQQNWKSSRSVPKRGTSTTIRNTRNPYNPF